MAQPEPPGEIPLPPKPPEFLQKLKWLKLYGLSHRGVIALALAITGLGWLASQWPWEPADPELPVTSPIETVDVGGLEVLQWTRELDLSAWRFVEPSSVGTRESLGVFRDSFLLNKVRDDAEVFLAQHGTTGLGLDVHPRTHDCQVVPFGRKQISGLTLLTKADVHCDISEAPSSTPFELRLEVDYWNAFNGAWAGLPISLPTVTASFRIVFPPGDPIESYQLVSFPRVQGATRTIHPVSDALLSNGGQELLWEISDPRLNHVYEVHWAWKDLMESSGN